MSDPKHGGPTEGEPQDEPDTLPDGSGPASHPGDTGDPDQFQG